ncbi:hypothetical protein GCM10027056_15810 [Glaciibacter psychrotolerans]
MPSRSTTVEVAMLLAMRSRLVEKNENALAHLSDNNAGLYIQYEGDT